MKASPGFSHRGFLSIDHNAYAYTHVAFCKDEEQMAKDLQEALKSTPLSAAHHGISKKVRAKAKQLGLSKRRLKKKKRKAPVDVESKSSKSKPKGKAKKEESKLFKRLVAGCGHHLAFIGFFVIAFFQANDFMECCTAAGIKKTQSSRHGRR